MKILLLLLSAVACSAATTATWDLTGYQDFLRGRMSGLTVSRDGRMTLGQRLQPVYSTDQAQIWSMAQASDGSLYLGTGNRGRLIRVTPNGQGSVLWTADQPVIFAVTVDRNGIVYAATSPEGKVYRIENGRATEYFAPAESYIWSLAFAPDGALYVGTGQRGRIYRVTAAGQGALYYETGQAHVTALAFDRAAQLLAGSEPNGILYRITGTPAKATVVYDANLPEIRTIIPASDGAIFVSALGGSVARQSGAASSTPASGSVTVTSTGTTMTVTDAQAGLNPGPKPVPQTAVSSSLSTAAVTTEVAGVERSALYKISPDSTVETLWSSKEENLYDVALEPAGTLLLLTDAQGRLYRLDARARAATLLAQTNEADAMRLTNTARGPFIATGSAAKLLHLETTNSPDAWFESPIHDAGAVARWGRLNAFPAATRGIKFKTRTGNSARPDTTWSEWADVPDAAIASPAARYIQWRAEFTTNASLDRVSLAYVSRNTPPIIRSLTVNALAANLLKPTTTASTSAAFSITVTDTGDVSSPAGTQAQVFPRPAGQQLQLSWQADDPEGDRLLYDLYFRGEDEREWKLLRADSSDNSFSVDGDSLGDGRYFFRVTASDRLSNPEPQARQSELISPPVLIDSTPPELKTSAPRRNGTTLEVDIDATDAASALKRCEYSVDAKPWQPVEASDGVTDSLRETFALRIANFPAGEHAIAIRVYDGAGNAGLARVILR